MTDSSWQEGDDKIRPAARARSKTTRAAGMRVYERCKRLIDTSAAGLCLLVLSPLFVLLAIAIKLDSPGPVLF